MNHDFNSRPEDKNFIRFEERNGEQEWVLMDHEGAGAIVRSWMPWRNQASSETDTRIRIYLDGATEPVLEGNMLGIFDGAGLIPYPLAHSSLRSAVSFFPIPYATSCKVTTTKRPFFYQFTFREYAEGTRVKTFTMEDFEAAKGLTENVGKTLLKPQEAKADQPLGFSTTLEKNAEESVELPQGAAAVRKLSVKLGSYEYPAVTRSVVLKMEFDGKETVFYEHPFHAQPHCHRYNKLNRKTNSRERNTQGYSTETRTRALDTMPFGNSLQLDMEVWSWTDCDMGYGVGIYWYGDAATTSNRKPEPVEVLNVPPVPEQGSR